LFYFRTFMSHELQYRIKDTKRGPAAKSTKEERKMRSEAVRKGKIWAVSVVLLAGLVYSLLALTLTAEPAYASSCDCHEDFTDASTFCAVQYGDFQLTTFTCPVGPQQNEFTFQCRAGGPLFSGVPCGSLEPF
jgi:hypothetical protein